MTDYQRLHELINDINYMVHIRAVFSSLEFENWYAKSEKIIAEIFGDDSYEMNYYTNTSYVIFEHALNSTDEEYEETSKEGLIAIKGVLVEYLKTFENRS